MNDTKSKNFLALLLFLTAASPGLRADAGLPAGQAGAPKDRAVSALEQDVKTDPNNTELWVHLGFAYRKSGQMDKAQATFEKVVSMDPKNRDALFMLGLIYESKHQTQEALKAWNEYLAAETDAEKREMAEKHIHHLSQ